MKHSALGILVLSILFPLAILGGDAVKTEKPPSVLLITLDTTRADRLGCYGGDRGLTPHLDAFAKTCARFAHCEAPVPITVPSHTSILSGWNPNRHGVRRNLEVFIPEGVPLLSEEFGAAGYSTGAFVSAFVLLGRYGLGRGFDHYDDFFYDPLSPGTVERGAEATLLQAENWLAEARGPFFCWIHLYDPHFPYEPPGPYAKKFAKTPYDGEIAYMDAALGTFFEKAEKAGLFGNTVVVICGDHGEGLGEHGEEAHGLFIYESTTHVPLLIRLPGGKGGKVVDADVSLVDIAPTLRTFAGLSEKPGDGFSLLEPLHGEKWEREAVYLESLEGLNHYGWAPLYGLVEGHHKFILAPREELYRIDEDPGELHNLVKAEKGRAEAMRKQLRARLSRTAGAESRAISLDERELESLQSLGYIGGAPGRKAPNYKDPKDALPTVKKHEEAVELMKSGQVEDALRIFEQIIRSEPTNSTAYYYAAVCNEGIDPSRSEKLYRKALEYRRDFLRAYVGLLALWENTGKSKEAYRLAQLALQEVDDVEGEIRVLQAWAAFEIGKPIPEVRALLDAAHESAPERGTALKLMALIALREGDEPAALLCIRKMEKVSLPGDIAVLAGDARFKALRDDPQFWEIVIRSDKKANAGR